MSRIILWLSNVLDLLPLVVLLFRYKRLDHSLQYFAAFLVITAFSDMSLDVLLVSGFSNSMPVIHVYLVGCVIFIAAVYYYALTGPFIKKIVAGLSAFSLIIMFIDAFFFEGMMEYPSISNTTLSILVIFFSLLYFYQLFNSKGLIRIDRQPFFWINTALLIDFSATILYFSLYKYLVDKKLWDYFNINDYANITLNILSTAGILLVPKKPV